MTIAYRIVTGLFCLMMLASAAYEVLAFDESVAFVTQLGYPAHVAYVLPLSKLLGVLAIATAYSATLREWAYAGFFFDFVLAILAHAVSGVPSPFPAAAALVLLMTSYVLGRRTRGGVRLRTAPDARIAHAA